MYINGLIKVGQNLISNWKKYEITNWVCIYYCLTGHQSFPTSYSSSGTAARNISRAGSMIFSEQMTHAPF